VNYGVKAVVVCWQVKLCDLHLSALEVRFSRRGAIQIHHLYLYLYGADIMTQVILRFHPFHLTYAGQRQTAAASQTSQPTWVVSPTVDL